MGMYTELFLTVELKKDLPQEAIDVLTAMVANEETGKEWGRPLVKSRIKTRAKALQPVLEIILRDSVVTRGGDGRLQ